ncbi:hypothetical protein VPFG_00165 [Vibrio phage nt-1]|uniref:Uncharacterized protein n=1 Tax=Vibrio phage nt-1 TaxID=115992 RepID=R9TJA0_9CAUD|nr:hypothetical protein VPFG_00165 [Vibrio phage nt-1]AGN30167.1 hypothetical protein VPFG_00165 [Vibrio phage nt-1]
MHNPKYKFEAGQKLKSTDPELRNERFEFVEYRQLKTSTTWDGKPFYQDCVIKCLNDDIEIILDSSEFKPA